MKKNVSFPYRLNLLVAALLTMTLCSCASQQYVTSFTPEQTTPRTLDMRYNGPRANIAVGDFTVKARGATNYIGDGLREMLQSALFESNRFYVLDRLDPEGMAAEQQLSYSKMASRDAPKLGAQMEVAELLFYGTVTEFEAEASGGGLKASAPNVPATASVGTKNAHMAIDIRVVDAATGRLVAARRISGSAASYKATAGTTLFDGLETMPVSLGVYKNTSMELAIRDCIYRSVIYAVYNLPAQYFKY
jgi:curli biogenesis system outer membrane secretion channel CsgG